MLSNLITRNARSVMVWLARLPCFFQKEAAK